MSIDVEEVPVRSGTVADWTASTLVLGLGELGFVTDTGEYRIGDGTSTFDNLTGRGGAFKRGTTTLVGGTKVVTGLTGVVAGDIVQATVRTLGTVTTAKAVLAVAGTNQVTITSADGTDTSVVAYVVYKA